MTPSTTISKTDGNLGVSSATERILAIIATASSGDYDTPISVTSKNDLTDEFTSGPLVEACAYMIARGIPVVAVRANPATTGSYGTIDDAGVTGTATVAAHTTKPDADYDVIVEILTGGALGTTGITFRYSLDGGVSYSDETALGTSLTLTCARGVAFALTSSTDTLVAGDTWTVSTNGPTIGTSDLSDSFAALKLSSLEWLRVLVVQDADATLIAQGESFATSFHADGKYPEVIMCTRPRTYASESRATYQAAMAAIAIAGQTIETSVCVDQCEVVSEVDGKRLRMATSIPYAARLMLIDDSQDAAAKSDGALPGVFLMTDTGDGKYHDERKYPGLDALGFTTLRTWGGRPITPGVYINNPRVISGSGSDYRYFQHSALINRVIEMTFQLFNNRLSKSVLVDTTTGKIRESSARALEEAVTADLRTAFEDSKRCSAVRCVVSRTDDILVTDTIHFDIQVVPLGVVKKFIGKAGLVRSLPA